MTGGARDPWTVMLLLCSASVRSANDNGDQHDDNATSAIADTAPIMFGPGGCSDRYMLVYPLLCPANDHAPLMVS